MDDLGTLLTEQVNRAPMPAADVMALALYHPEHGYYRRPSGPWGFEGKDYYTALDCGALLGQALARRLETVWLSLDRPGVFTVVEPGAGRGWLGRDLLASATGDFRAALRYVHRDDNPAARSAAEAALEPWLKSGQARLVSESEPLPAFTGAVVSNELFDAMPAQPYRFRGGVWEREMLTAQGPAWEPREPDEAIRWFEAQGAPQEGDGSVWVQDLPIVVASLLTPLEKGLFLAVDYGDSAERLLAKGADLRRYRAHQVDGAWWDDLGKGDLTADVDFTRLESLVRAEGWHPSTRSLSAWVRQHAPLAEWEAAWQGLEARDRLARMENLLQLTLPGGLGERFRVLEALRHSAGPAPAHPS